MLKFNMSLLIHHQQRSPFCHRFAKQNSYVLIFVTWYVECTVLYFIGYCMYMYVQFPHSWIHTNTRLFSSGCRLPVSLGALVENARAVAGTVRCVVAQIHRRVGNVRAAHGRASGWGGRGRGVGAESVFREVGMSQRFRGCEALLRVEHQHLLQQEERDVSSVSWRQMAVKNKKGKREKNSGKVINWKRPELSCCRHIWL